MLNVKIVDEGLINGYIYKVCTKDIFDEDYSNFVDSQYVLAVKQVKQYSTLNLGIVFYVEPNFYKDKTIEELSNIHIPGIMNENGRKLLTEFLKMYFIRVYSHEIKQITLGHEHGDKDKKCHIQVCVEFLKTFRGSVKPSSVNFLSQQENLDNDMFEDLKLLFMAQTARNPRALQQYCKKDGDFWYLYPELAIKYIYNAKLIEGKQTVNLWSTLAVNRNLLSSEDAKDLIRQHDPRTFYIQGKNLDYQLERDMASHMLPLVWTYPQHLIGVYSLIEKWFYNWCIPVDLRRRKALLLYSPERCMGKTEFALSLVNDLGYAVCFRNTFVQDNLKGKIPKLLILDDMSPPDIKNKETWKALVAGQKTSIRDCHFNFAWEFEVPCIITTNNEFLVKLIVTNPEFNTQVMCQYINEYMGPPGTKPEGLDVIDNDLPEWLMDKFRRDRIEFEKKRDEERLLGKKQIR